MLSRLRRPGYWILLLVGLTVYFYHAYQKREEAQRLEARFRLYQSYGDALMGAIGEGNLSALQARFGRKKGRELSLEEAALFVTTMHLDRASSVAWKEWKEAEGNVTLHGELQLEGNLSYPMDLMLVRRGEGELLLDRLRVGSRSLELRPEGFPIAREGNRTVVGEKAVEESMIESRKNQEDKGK